MNDDVKFLIERLQEADRNPASVSSWRDLVQDASTALLSQQEEIARLKGLAEAMYEAGGKSVISRLKAGEAYRRAYPKGPTK